MLDGVNGIAHRVLERRRDASVTVVGPSLADAYATAAFSMADDAARWIASLPDYEGIVITAGDRVIQTEGMDRFREES